VAPSTQNSRAWRLVVPAVRKVRKVAFFCTVFASSSRVTLAARQFIIEKPRIGLSLMHRLAAHSKPLGGFWEF